jgi:hypothetical protein
VTERIPKIMDDLEKLSQIVDQRHTDNLDRLARIGEKVAELQGEIKVIIALLAANVVLNIASLFHH